MHISVTGGDLPGLHKLMELMKDVDQSVLVGVPAGAMEDGRHARTEAAAKKLHNRRVKRAAKSGKVARAEFIFAEAKTEAIPLAMIAAVHEFGSPEHNIPERSFLRGGIRRGTPKFHAVNVDSLKRVVNGEMTVDQAVNKLGVVAVGEVKREFTVGKFVPLKPATIKRKGSSRPLVDTGQLRQSITYVLEGKQSANAKVVG